jgi:hypothetical protein
LSEIKIKKGVLMKAEKWLEIIVCVVIIGLLGGLLKLTFDMKYSLGKLEGTTSSTSERIDRIVAVMPDMMIRVAHEETKKPFKAALITTKPIERSPGNWISVVHFMDTEKVKRSTFEVPLDGPDDEELKNLITGIAFRLDEYSLSFNKLKNFSSEIGEPVTFPMEIDDKTSFLLYKSSEKVGVELDFLKTTPKIYSLPSKIDTWSKLTEEIKINKNDYILEQSIKKK